MVIKVEPDMNVNCKYFAAMQLQRVKLTPWAQRAMLQMIFCLHAWLEKAAESLQWHGHLRLDLSMHIS